MQSKTSPVSDTVGAPTPERTGRSEVRKRRFRPSLAVRLALLVVIFVSVPFVIYNQFREADAEKQSLLQASVREQGRLIAEVLRPELEKAGLQALPEVGPQLSRFAGKDTIVKLLFRPKEAGDSNRFYFVASAPAVAAAALRRERQRLMDLGVLDKLAASCAGQGPVQTRRLSDNTDEEIVTSVTPIHTGAGCWTLVTASNTAAYRRLSIGQPYWMTPEIRFAAIIYVVMALITITVFLGIWRSLRRFADLARDIRVRGLKGGRFSSENRLREFDGVAQELDHMVATLEESSRTIRQAAEENAHAFKTPIAVISQSVEPLRRVAPDENSRAARALSMIEHSVERLDELVACSRQMDEVVADLIDPPRVVVDLSELLQRVMEGCAAMFAGQNVLLRVEVDEDITVRAGEELLETVIENLVENAVRYTAVRGAVMVRLKRQKTEAVLTVEDNGPGVPADELELIFERYYSRRRTGENRSGDEGRPATPGDRHFGIGLWIVRRNIQAVGGTVIAENREGGGLRIRVRLPLAEHG